MVLAALTFVAWPLFKTSRNASDSSRHLALIVVAVLIPLIAVILYSKLGRFRWQEELAASAAQTNPNAPEVQQMVAKLEKRLAEKPNDLDGWLMLGRSYLALEKMPAALVAYQKAYALDKENIEATMGLGEAMIMTDERAIAGEAGRLFEVVLTKEPNNPKALWYGAIGALTTGNLPTAQDRLQRMLALGPPANIRSIIERQLQDIQQQLGVTEAPVSSSAQSKITTESQRAVNVQVSIKPELEKTLDKKTPLFILVRDPAAPGPPFAAVRRAVGDLPLSVSISDRDAMMQGRGISNVESAQVVARVSKSGAPQAQPGDLYGEAQIKFDGNKAVNIKIVIDQVVGNAANR
jgi:cytochrome c-type biogenesis protein CcmH